MKLTTLMKPRGLSLTGPLLALAVALLYGLPGGAAEVLYAISGDGAAVPSSLYTLDLTSGAPNLVGALGNGDDGEAIAFGSDPATLFHASGGTDGAEFFETVNPDTLAPGPNLANGAVFGPAPASELLALGWYAPLGVFLASDINLGFYHVTPNGSFEQRGSSGLAMRGFAVQGGRVFGIGPQAQALYEIDPSDGSVLASHALTVDGIATTGNGLATHPETGVVYALVKDPANPSGGRLLATIDVDTGQAISLGNTGLKLASLSFRSHLPLYAISGDGASPASSLYRLDLGNGASTLLATLGNGDDGEAIGAQIGDGRLYHTSGVSDGSEFFERITAGSWDVGPNLAPGATYGPDPASEVTAIAWYPPLGVFLVGDVDANLYHVTTLGQFTLVGNSGLRMRGFAVVGAQVFGLNPFAQELFEVDPSNGAILDTLPLSVDGTGTTGNGLTTNPQTGAVFAIVKNPFAPGAGRLLARLDVTTGQAVSLGDTGHKLAGITFGDELPPATPLPALGHGAYGTLLLALLVTGFSIAAGRRPSAVHGLEPRSGGWRRCMHLLGRLPGRS